jgi:hypothetical protein
MAFVPWKSPGGTPMSLAAAVPTIPWSDLISSLLPNGHGLTYTITDPAADSTPAGVEKQSFVTGLFATGQVEPPSSPGVPATGYFAPPGVDPTADLLTWYGLINATPDPYESNPQFAPIISQLKFKGPWYMLNGALAGSDSVAPAPMLFSNGFTDDLFPVDESVRYINLERSLFPSDPISMIDMDYGHMRGQDKVADLALLEGQVQAWLDHYVLGSGPDPGQNFTALTQTCPPSASSGGPFVASSFAGLAPGELDYTSAAAQTITSTAGDVMTAKTIDPIAGGGACATVPATDQAQPGVATYRLPAAQGSGYTLLGGPIVIANVAISGSTSEVAERLWDVAPGGTQTLVARGDYRPSGAGSQTLIFQLHPGAWHVAAGHVVKLELLGQDQFYLRPDTSSFSITVSSLGLILPVHETSGNGIHPIGALPAPAGSVPAPGVSLYTPTGSTLGIGNLCLSHRTVVVHLPRRGGGTLVSVRVTVNGKRVTARFSRATRAVRLSLYGLPKGTVHVVIRARVRHGTRVKTLTFKRTLHACTSGRAVKK